jgi:hypothetical protein
MPGHSVNTFSKIASIYPGGSQKLQIKEGQTIQWQIEKIRKENNSPPNTIKKTKN